MAVPISLSNRNRISIAAVLVAISCFAWTCGYYLIPGPFQPFAADLQSVADPSARMEIFDDGTAAYIVDRLEVSVRYMSDEELNRQFASFSADGRGPADELPTNALTHGDWKDPRTGLSPQRLSVFKVSVKNYQFPKVKFDPLDVTVVSDNGRTYYPWGSFDVVEYFRRFALAYNGLGYERFQERRGMMTRLRYPDDEFVFSGQTVEGFVVFPKVHDDVERVTFHIVSLGTRYDFRSEPVEQIDLAFRFERQLRRVRTYDELAAQTAQR